MNTCERQYEQDPRRGPGAPGTHAQMRPNLEQFNHHGNALSFGQIGIKGPEHSQSPYVQIPGRFATTLGNGLKTNIYQQWNQNASLHFHYNLHPAQYIYNVNLLLQEGHQ